MGTPRSGTTWVARAIAAVPKVDMVHEPDNDEMWAISRVCTARLGPLPQLERGDKAPLYQLLWDLAFSGWWSRPLVALQPRADSSRLSHGTYRRGLIAAAWLAARRPRSDRIHVVKSVRAYCSVEWLVDRYRPTVVAMKRNPLNVLSSWLQLGYAPPANRTVRQLVEPLGAWPPPVRTGDGLERAVWDICAHTRVLLQAADRHGWLVVRHEDLCADPPARLQDLFQRIGVPWDRSVEEFLARSNRPGSGWPTERIAQNEIEGWRRRLSDEDVAIARRVMEQFGELSVSIS